MRDDDDSEAQTTLDVPSLADLERWESDAHGTRLEAAPEPANPTPRDVPVSTRDGRRADEHQVDSVPSDPPAELTDWMSPEELEVALSAGKPTAKPRRQGAPRTPYTTPRPLYPAWLVPLIAACAFALIFGSLALVLLFG